MVNLFKRLVRVITTAMILTWNLAMKTIDLFVVLLGWAMIDSAITSIYF